MQHNRRYTFVALPSSTGTTLARRIWIRCYTGQVKNPVRKRGYGRREPCRTPSVRLRRYTYTVLVTLEDYGFCAKGGWSVCRRRQARPGGTLPTNTGGGELSSFLWVPVTEAVIQGRGHGGERQVDNDLILVTGNGVLNYHSTLLLSPQAA